MKYIGKKSVSFAMEIILVGLIGVNILVLIFLPQITTYYLQRIYGTQEVCAAAKRILLVVLYPCGISALVVELSLKKIFRSLVDKDPFVQKNVTILKVMGVSMTVVTVFLVIKIVLLNSIMTMCGALASGLLVVFCFVLADVFQQAVYYKQDNDLTV